MKDTEYDLSASNIYFQESKSKISKKNFVARYHRPMYGNTRSAENYYCRYVDRPTPRGQNQEVSNLTRLSHFKTRDLFASQARRECITRHQAISEAAQPQGGPIGVRPRAPAFVDDTTFPEYESDNDAPPSPLTYEKIIKIGARTPAASSMIDEKMQQIEQILKVHKHQTVGDIRLEKHARAHGQGFMYHTSRFEEELMRRNESGMAYTAFNDKLDRWYNHQHNPHHPHHHQQQPHRHQHHQQRKQPVRLQSARARPTPPSHSHDQKQSSPPPASSYTRPSSARVRSSLASSVRRDVYSRATDHQHVQAWSRRVRETAGNKKLNEEVYGTQPTDNELMLHTSGGSAEGDSTMGAFQKLEDGDLIAWKSTDINPLTVSTNKSSKSASASHILASNGVGIGKKSARTAAGIKGDNNENDENNNSINIHDKISANAGATPVSATSSPAAKKKTQKSMRAFGRKKTQRKTADQIINEIVVKERAKKAKTYIPPQRKWKEKPVVPSKKKHSFVAFGRAFSSSESKSKSTRKNFVSEPATDNMKPAASFSVYRTDRGSLDDSQLYPRSNNEDLEVLTGALYSSEDEEGGNGDYSGDGDRAQQRDGEGKKNRAPMLSAEESIRQQMMHSMELTLSAMDPSGGTEVDRRKKMKEEQEKKKIMYTRLMRSSPRSPRPPRQTKKASVTAARQNAYRTFRSSHSTLTRPATARPHRTVNTTTATRSSTKSQSSRTRPHSSTHSHSRHPSQAQERKEVEEARTHLSRMNVTFKGSHLERAITTPRYQLTEFEKQTLFVGHLSERLMKNPYWKNQGRAKSSKKNRKPKKWKFQKKKAKVTSQVEGLVRDADLKAAFNRVKKLPMAEKKEMFELDWDQMVLSDEMVEVEYRSALKEMFWKHYDQIIYIYDYYASAVTVKTKSGDVRSIQRVSLLGFLQFCQICKITDKIVKPRHLNTLFHRCTYKEGMQAGENDEAGDIAGDYDTIIGRENNAFRKHMKHAMKHLYHPAHMLHRAAFMEALIRMALLKFANRLMYLDYPPDQSLHTLMVEFIIPRAILPSDLKSHIRRRMLAEEVDAVLRQYSKRMNGLFLSYCIKDNAHKVKLYVSEFQDLMMQNFESTDRNIPMRVLNGLDPKLEKDSERGNEYFMNFPQFMECFVRVADQEYRQIDTSHKSPDLPLSMKMRQLLSSKWA